MANRAHLPLKPNSHEAWYRSPILWLIIAVALGLRLYSTFHESLIGDEIFTAHVAGDSLRGGLGTIVYDAVHPPLHYLLAKIFGFAFGYDPVVLRLLSVIFGVATVILVAWLAFGVFADSRIALLAAGLVAISDSQVMASHLARSYALFSTIVVLLMIVLWRRMTESGDLRSWAGVAIVAALLAQTSYVGWLYLLSTLPAILVARTRHLIKGWLVSVAVAVGCFLPWMGLVGVGIADRGGALARVGLGGGGSFSSLNALAGAFARLGGLPGRGNGWIIASLAAALVPLGALVACCARCDAAAPRKQKGRGVVLVLSLAVGPPLLLFAVALPASGVAIWGNRFLVPSVGPWALAVSAGVVILWNRKRWLGALAGATVVAFQAVPTANATLHHRFIPFREAASCYVSHRGPGEPLYTLGRMHFSPIAYYLPGQDSPEVLNAVEGLPKGNFWVLFAPDEKEQQEQIGLLESAGFTVAYQHEFSRTLDGSRVQLARFKRTQTA